MGKWTGLLYDTRKDLEDKGDSRRTVQEGKGFGKERLRERLLRR